MLRLDGVSQQYLYGAEALKDICFGVETGERISLLGASGAGKTTLIKTVCGIISPEKGSISLDGRDITALPPKFRSVRAIYDREGFFNRRSVAYNLEYPLKIRKYPKKERKIKVLQAADEFGFAALTDDFLFRHDDETKLRIALSRLDLYAASLTLLDNPFSVLTGEKRRELFAEMLPKICARVSTALFATDSAEEAFSFSDEVLFLQDGKIVDSGDLTHFLTDPDNLYSDKYVNADRNFSEVEVSDGIAEFFGRNIRIFDAVPSVTVSFVFKRDESGEAMNGYGIFGEFGIRFFRTEGGAVLPEVSGRFLPDFESVRIFNSADGKRLTFGY